ncbi:MAG: ABC transporter ATP-binding protein, partial [Fervidicoccaceae archaeon]
MIDVQHVWRFFGGFKALEDVSFTVRNGEVVGYVGLNGAGKTTTIRIAVGVLPPSRGDVLIDGYSVTRDKRRASMLVGWVPELPVFESDFKALDYFVYLAGYYGYSISEARRIARELLERFGLGSAVNMKLSDFSQGMKKRFALAVS